MEKDGAAATPGELTVHRRALKAITGVRFFAAFYVVLFHTRMGRSMAEHGMVRAGYFFGNGYLAVPLFFLLSGFILAYTYAGQIDKPGGYRRFWEARFARIWPVYALSMVLASIPHANFASGWDVAASVLMVQAWNPFRVGMAGAGNIVCWTLSVEALFYVIFPWVQTWVERRSLSAAAWATGAMLAVCIGLNTASRTLGYAAYGVFRWVPLAALHVPEFLTGVGLGNYFLRRLMGRQARGRNGLITYGSMLAAVVWLCRPGDGWTSVVVVAFAGVILGLAEERTLVSRFLSTQTMVLAGGISYSVYLMQMPVKSWVMTGTEAIGLRSEVGRLGLTAVALIVVSWVLFRWVEDPARRVLRSGFAALEERRMRRAGV